jgi:GTPase
MKKKSPKPPADQFRCGMVSIVGRPNVGKSTLLNKIIGQKVSIVSKVPQTTRNQVRGIYHDERGQIVFIDTPGLVAGKDRLDKLLKQSSLRTMDGVDCIIHLVDAKDPPGFEEEQLVHGMKDLRVPVVLGLNKVDLGTKFIPQYIALWERKTGKPIPELKNFMMISLSGKKGTNIDQLLEILFERMPEGPALYPDDMVIDVPQKMVIADIIREKLLALLREEVPHSVAVFIEEMESQRNNLLHIRAVIMVDRESHKGIVIGKDGQVLKKIGTLAREELQSMLETKVFLELYVKTKKNWRDNNEILRDLGYEQE